MSGGANRKKASRSQGWEEAGSEFYQESYPVDADIEILQRDPKHLATLLPSKQNRTAAATIRNRTNDTRTNNRTVRRRTATQSRRGSTMHHRASPTGEVQVSMLPDLSEMRTNEQTSWEEIMQIKTLPLPMREKKEMKAKILNEPNLRLQGFEQLKWKRRKLWGQLRSRLRESFNKTGLWRGSLKHIEGNFGTGVVAFFLFLKWLFLLNAAIFSLLALFVVLPTVLLDYDRRVNCQTGNDNGTCCAQEYFEGGESARGGNVVVDLIQGTGFLEKTVLFYGFYSDKTVGYRVGGVGMLYNLPLAYLVVVVVCLAGSLGVIVRSAARGFRERLVEGEGQFYQYCNLVFGGWDFCIDNERAARTKHRAIYSEIRACLATERLREEKRGRTAREKLAIVATRALVNAAVLAILVACGWLVYEAFEASTRRRESDTLLLEFLPSATVVGLNVVVPQAFALLMGFEKYAPPAAVRMALFRTVFLRLASLMVFYASVHREVECAEAEEEGGCRACEAVPACWETFVGQQVLKLLLTDVGTQLVMTLVVNSARALLARRCASRAAKLLGEQTFDLPRHALDLIYTQTLCWFGLFYAPLLSLLAVAVLLLLFYLKKFACLVNCKPGAVIYRASRSTATFQLVLLVSFAFAVLPVAFSFAARTPSRSCGPFRGQRSVWGVMVDLFARAPRWVQDAVHLVGTAGFAVPCIVVLVLCLYYYTAVNAANRHLVEVLKNQLVLEGHDKQFLLDRLSLFIRQEGERRARAEMSGGRS